MALTAQTIPAGTTLAEMMTYYNDNIITADTFRYWLDAAGFDGADLIMNPLMLQSLVESNPNASTPEDFTPIGEDPQVDIAATGQGASTTATGAPDDTFLDALESMGAFDPATRYRDFIRDKWGVGAAAPISEQIGVEERLSQGYMPTMGGYLVGEARKPFDVSAPVDKYRGKSMGDIFGAYLKADERPTLKSVRDAYSDMATSLSTTAGAGKPFNPQLTSLYGVGNPKRTADTKARMMSSALAALGGNPFMMEGRESLGQVYDVMMGRNPTGGYGDFSKWLSTAYQS